MANRYWVGNGGNWTDTAHWSLTSGGAGGASVPTDLDDVFFNASSFSVSSQTVTVNSAGALFCLSMDWAGATNNPTLALTTSLAIYGTLFRLSSGMSTSSTGGQLLLYGDGVGTLSVNTNGVTINASIVATYHSTTISLSSDLVVNGTYLQDCDAGTSALATNNYNITCVSFNADSDSIVNLGTSTITVSEYLDLDYYGDGTNNLSATSAMFYMTGLSFYFYINSLQTVGTVVLLNSTKIYFTGGTINTLNLTAGKTYTMDVSGANDTLNIGTLNARGSAGNLITFVSDPASTVYTFSKASGTIAVVYVSMSYSTASGGATFRAYSSTDGGNNTGWSFLTGLPTEGSFFQFI